MSKKKCFVISPIGSEDSSERIAADWFLEYIVRAALDGEYEVRRGEDYEKSDIITNQIILAIRDADLIVADLTNHNANVHYELGVAHAMGRPVVPFISKGQVPPFDNGAMRTFPYSIDRPASIRAAMQTLRNSASAMVGAEVQNPVTMALGVAKLQGSATSGDRIMADLVTQVAELRAIVDGLQQLPEQARGNWVISPDLPVDAAQDYPRRKVYVAHSGRTNMRVRDADGPFDVMRTGQPHPRPMSE